LLAALVTSATTPSAIELLAGPLWRENRALGLLTAGSLARLAVGLEGSPDEVRWMLGQLAGEWRDLGVTRVRSLHESQAAELWSDLAEFPSAPGAPLVIKAGVLPSRTTEFCQLVLELDPQASIQSHAGNGIVIPRFDRFAAGDVSRSWIGRLQPAAARFGGSLVVLSSSLEGLTRQAAWGGAGVAVEWMSKVKRQFDPKNLLNPGRFVYDSV
jgi:glycolate oxidase FAD binding subunit